METQNNVAVLCPAPESHPGKIDKDDYLFKFSLRHPGLFISMVSLNYPFKEAHLQRYKAILDWKGLTENLLWRPEKPERAPVAPLADPEREEKQMAYYCRYPEEMDDECIENIKTHFRFTAENIGRIIKKMKDQDAVDIFSTLVSMAEKLEWNEEVIDRYAGFWDWGELALNLNLPWTPEFIRRYADKWNWSALSQNTQLPLVPGAHF